MKRIVFTVTNDITYDQRMQKICRSLANAGYEVELVGRLRNFSLAIKTEPYLQTRLNCFFNKGKLFYLEYNLRLLFYLTFSQFDAACAIDLDTIVPVYIIGKLKGAKLIYDAHEYFTEVPEVIRRPMVKKIWKWVEKTFVPKFDLIYTVSEGLAELFRKEYAKNIEVIMNAPLLENKSTNQFNKPVTDKKSSYVLYQGALNEGRGLEQLIEAMKEIDLKLKIAGEGDLSQQLHQLVKQANLQGKIEFLGYIEPNELRTITDGALVGINALEETGLSYYHSLSNKFFDYIHAGVPQVCNDFPEYRKINNHYQVAVLIKDCSPAEIKGAILRLANDKDLYTRLKINCDVCSGQLNWQNEEKKLLGLYGHLFR